MTYRKLFPIEFNKKYFMLFLDEKERCAFLEINKDGKLDYPMLEDFISLHEIFNNSDSSIVYNIHKIKFKECVKTVKSGVIKLLIVTALINSMPNVMASSNVDVQEDSIVISSEPQLKTYSITDTEDLSKYLGEVNLTKELILKAINENKNLSISDEGLPNGLKPYVIKQFETLYSKYPKDDYRIFYENIKTLNVKFYSNEDYNKTFRDIPGSSAHYNSMTNRINFQKNPYEHTIYHELAHTYQFLYRMDAQGNIVIRSDKHSLLIEGEANRVAKLNTSFSTTGSYRLGEDVLEFLQYITGYTHEEISRFGIEGLIVQCERMYPDRDFRYISASLNAIKNSEISEYISMTEDPIDLYEELFTVALDNASIAKGYEPFNKFLDILSITKNKFLIDGYLDRYNSKLESLGYFKTPLGKAIQRNFKIYENANCIIDDYEKDTVEFGIRDKKRCCYKINEDGTQTEVGQCSSHTERFDFVKIKALTKGIDVKESLMETLQNEEKVLDQYWYSPVSVNLNGKLLTSAMLNTLKIQVGFTEDDGIGFVISMGDSIIYQSPKRLINLSSKYPLCDYLNNFSFYNFNGKTVDLDVILEKDTLKNVQLLGEEATKFLLQCTGCSYEKYASIGATGLIEMCKKMYPDVDFRYVSAALNCASKSEINESTLRLMRNFIPIFDELFEVALRNVSIENGYKPFKEFKNILTYVQTSDLIKNYLDRYNSELEKIGYFKTPLGKTI